MAVAGAVFANLPEDLVTAAVGAVHLARGRGGASAQRHATFLCRCGREGLLPWAQVLLLLLLRQLPRLLPPAWLAAMMRSPRSTDRA